MRVLPKLLLIAGLGACSNETASEPEEPTPQTATATEPDGAPEPASSEPPSSQVEIRDPNLPATAKPDIDRSMREGLAAVRTPADLGGSVELQRIRKGNDEFEHVRVGQRATFDFRFTVGPDGIAEGGALYFQVSPFWGWSTPQSRSPAQAGYTSVVLKESSATFEAETLDQQLIAFTATGGDIAPGTTVELSYGAGAAGAVCDRYAESASAFYFAVDGDGDGVRGVLNEPPTVRILPAYAARLVATVTSTVRPGDTARLTLAVLDAWGNASPEFEGFVDLSCDPPLASLPERVEIGALDRARCEVEFDVDEAGTYLITAEAQHADDAADAVELRATTANPLRVSRAPRLVWVDLHGHSALSDGTGSPADYYDYARSVAALDAVALTDHDAWGLLPLQNNADLWDGIVSAARAADAPGRFLALPGFEWTSWIFGHRHVVYFGEATPLLSSLDDASDTPEELWAALEPLPALSIPHHPAGGPIAIDYAHDPPPAIEPLLEICSVHGASDAPDSPHRIYSSVPGHFAVDALNSGLRYGFLGSGDSHDGHPGLPQLAGPTGGLAAVMCEDLTADALLAALRERRVYATSGARVILRANVGGAPMGSTLRAADIDAESSLLLEIIGSAPIETVDLVTSVGTLGVVTTPDDEEASELELRGALPVPPLQPGQWFYIRVVQSDRELAWSSPFWFE